MLSINIIVQSIKAKKLFIGGKMAINHRPLNWILILLILWLTSGSNLKAQETDPFYLNLLNQGEKSFSVGNYKQAVKELEIAAFGLLEENLLRAKAYIYLGLSYYNLRDLGKSKEYLIKAKECLGQADPHQLNLNETLIVEFNNLLNSFQAAKRQKIIPEKKLGLSTSDVRASGREEKAKLETVTRIEELRKSIKADPRNVSLHYKLYQIYLEQNNLKEAKKVLKDLAKKNPTEINSYYLLGKIEFKERKYKEAQQAFEKMLNLSERIKFDKKKTAEAKAYLILSTYFRGKRKDTQKMVVDWREELTPAKISLLSLDIAEKETLQRIISAYKIQVKTKKDNS